MKKGYQVMELSLLDPLFSQRKYFDFAIAIFYWLIRELHVELKDQLAGAQIEVIRVEYLGAYPALGIHYGNSGEVKDLEPLVEATIYRLLQEKPVIELVTFIAASGTDWKEVTTKLMTE